MSQRVGESPISGPALTPSRARRWPLRPDTIRTVAIGILSIVAVLAFWSFVARLINNPLVMPGPLRVLEAIITNFTTLDPTRASGWQHLADTMRRILISFVLSMVIGSTIGITMGMFRDAERFLVPIVTTGLAIPSLSWAVISVMWFGVSEFTGLFAIVAVTVPFVVVSIWEGTKSVDRDLIQMARVYDATTQDIVRRIYLPHLAPFLFGAIRYGFALSWKIAVLAEVFGLSSGVGYIFNFWYQQFNLTQVIAWTATFAVIILLVENVLIAPLRAYVFRWKPADPGRVTGA